MLSISEFFKKIRDRQSREIFLRSMVQKAIREIGEFDIGIESISFKSSTVILDGISQTARSQVFIKKQKIISMINSSQNIRNITDIR